MKPKSKSKKKPELPKGWQCPCCDAVHSPEVKECRCKKVSEELRTKQQKEMMEKLKEFNDEWKKRDRNRPEPPPMSWPPRYVPMPIYVYPPPWNPPIYPWNSPTCRFL